MSDPPIDLLCKNVCSTCRNRSSGNGFDTSPTIKAMPTRNERVQTAPTTTIGRTTGRKVALANRRRAKIGMSPDPTPRIRLLSKCFSVYRKESDSGLAQRLAENAEARATVLLSRLHASSTRRFLKARDPAAIESTISGDRPLCSDAILTIVNGGKPG
jgi:hypothetical protein